MPSTTSAAAAGGGAGRAAAAQDAAATATSCSSQAAGGWQVLESMQQLPERYKGILLDQFGVRNPRHETWGLGSEASPGGPRTGMPAAQQKAGKA